MGLLSAACGRKKSLASKPENFSALTFPQWAKKNGFEHCGVFRSKNGLMVLEFAAGVDAQSVFKSISTQDFWNGSVHSDTWITVDHESPNFSAFTQFLGQDARSKVKAFRILKILDGEDLVVFFEYSFEPAGFLRAKENFSQELLEVLKSHKQNLMPEPTRQQVQEIAKKNNVRLFLISTKRALQEASKKIEVCETTLLKLLINTIFEELFYKTKNLFAAPATIYAINPDEIKVAAIVNSDVDDEILREQLSLEYEGIIGMEAAKKIIILTAGFSNDSEEIHDYLLRG